jgi:hypothetical protein
MNRDDLGALKNLYEGLNDSPSVDTDKPTVTKTLHTGLGIYESQIQDTNIKGTAHSVLSEEVESVTKITASTPSTTPLKTITGTFSEASWGTMSTVKDIAGIYSALYENKDQDNDGDNDFDDVRIARMIASGMSREEAIKKCKEDPKGDNESEKVEEVYQGKHGQSATAYADSRSSGGKMVSGDSKMSGAEYTHGRRVTAANPGMQPDVGGKTKPKSQGKMDRGSRIDLMFRKANLKKANEETEMSNEHEVYNVVSTYLLENNFAESQESADAIIENMSSEWVEQVVEEYNEYVDEYNLFLEELNEVGVDINEWTDEELEEAYKKLPFRKMVKQAKSTGKNLDDVMKVAKDHNPTRMKGRSSANKMAGALTGGRAADRKLPPADKSKDVPGGYGDMTKYTGDIYAKKFKPGKTVPKQLKFGRPFGKYAPKNINFKDIKDMGLD